MRKYGFKKDNISVIPIALDLKPIENIDEVKKYDNFTICSLSAIRSMKKTIDQVKAFEIAKEKIPELRMKIAGEIFGNYGKKLLKYIRKSKYKKDIEYLGKINQEKKIQLLQKSHLICATSVKEGWGLIITEAASQGTPAVVYSVDGLKDTVNNKETGLICEKNNPYSLAENIIKLYKNNKLYKNIRIKSWEFSQNFFWNKTLNKFISNI